MAGACLSTIGAAVTMPAAVDSAMMDCKNFMLIEVGLKSNQVGVVTGPKTMVVFVAEDEKGGVVVLIKHTKRWGEKQRAEHYDPLSPFPSYFHFPSGEPENQFPT